MSTNSMSIIVRTHTAERLAAAADKVSDKNRSDDLAAWSDKYKTFAEQMKPFIVALKNYHASLINLEHNRSELLQQIEIFTTGTPLFPHAGKGNKVLQAAPTWAKTFSNKKDHSYCSMERQMSALNVEYARHVQEYCIDYVNEWEIVVNTRIQSGITKAEELKKNWLHYDKKVQQLEEAESKLVDKGKAPDTKAKDKLKRNQEKLDIAKSEFDKYATGVCQIIESALDCAWMDMTPIVYRLANMELDRMGGQQDDSQIIAKSLVDLVQKLKEFAQEHKVDLTLPEATAKRAPASATAAVATKAKLTLPEATAKRAPASATAAVATKAKIEDVPSKRQVQPSRSLTPSRKFSREKSKSSDSIKK